MGCERALARNRRNGVLHVAVERVSATLSRVAGVRTMRRVSGVMTTMGFVVRGEREVRRKVGRVGVTGVRSEGTTVIPREREVFELLFQHAEQSFFGERLREDVVHAY
jgi:hypothetical protein